MARVIGIDSSTQSTKALLVDADSGEILESRKVAHPDGTEVDPKVWLAAVDEATAPFLNKAHALAVGGQQHGMVALDEANEPVRDALLWNDTRSAGAAEALIAEMGGPEQAVYKTGSVHVASITSTKLRWMRDHEPENAKRTHRVVLPHDYVSYHLSNGDVWFTDRGDASGTGYFDPHTNAWSTQLKVQALGKDFAVPTIAPRPNAIMGRTPSGAAIAPGTGDNMAAALGLGLEGADASISIGTSGVVAMTTPTMAVDPTGSINGFADATGAWLPLACTLNASRILDFGCELLGVDYEGLSDLALASEPGARSAVFVPYLDGERTPNRPHETGRMVNLTRKVRREDFARAIVEGLLCSLADALHLLEKVTSQDSENLLLIGGGAKSRAVRELAPTIFGRPIFVPEEAEYVALGAARQAAWALSGKDTIPQWAEPKKTIFEGDHHPEVLATYRDARGE
ncbi:xylulokinase [Corynebacterium cystitidis]|uniref:Xylulose kinase n=1 Tax=Corynebacterium cystitidis DSM 20524 TaxID=1121357 RepID=A0A1H9UWU5_9CORY|nr:xylulokinase [Corynebacterium cystitidis]WJY83671.1 Xylulose kinase [Corynebacterium cystitidis DSM 20524]SES13809.1 xylulokinase [Corynebacterium cystitidis DSM 20524]SNV91404.1 xylulokinase [Corynebacterium cystitidis]